MIWKIGQKSSSKPSANKGGEEENLAKAKDSLRALAEDPRLDTAARLRLGEEYRQLHRYLEKLEQGHIHVAAFGRVSVGKSALLNALLGQRVFKTSVLHGETKHSQQQPWDSYDSGGVFLIDTPGIDEIDGEERERIAREVAQAADLLLFVVDGDLTMLEYQALQSLYNPLQPLILVLNKADRLSLKERGALLLHLQRLTENKFPIVATSAEPDEYIEEIDTPAGPMERTIRPLPDINNLRDLLWRLLQESGKSYAALNASLFAGQISERVGQEIVRARGYLAEQIINRYGLLKAVAVAVNPVPAMDLLALAVDGSMIGHLSKVYGIEFSKSQINGLLKTIGTQTALLMGTVYGVHLMSSLLKGLTGGLSTLLTASAQGAVAFYGSHVIGRAAEVYFSQGASWGERGAKRVIKEIVASLDKDALIKEAQEAIKNLK